ncbi:hypothetical protein P691DRAFT_735810 [Macrolepiota fuliginosa MF-IS2]|uniref:Uncharacterized protein n=1 Tax=Macrolepiota fuliginosa MF-IS2 TaxID=1400762 RepID=A0A9P6C103_9AGAR|nr:hypothetical protein P691DRAFT_735810 [Macrolepiota fuliginosa MF-IS2]
MRTNLVLSCLVLPLLLVLSVVLSVLGVPTSIEGRRETVSENSSQRRTTPFFPDQPPSCPICAQDYPNISSCAEAAPVLQNFSSIIFNPGAFIDVIKCACVDTFQSVFPQCVDCFLKTGQENVLNTSNLPGVVDGMRKICAVESSLLGNVSATNNETTPGASAPVPLPTGNTAAATQLQTRVLLATILGVGFSSLVL